MFYFLLFALFIVFPNDVTACDINVTITSQSYYPVYAQLIFHDGRRTVLYFPYFGSAQSTRITGAFCNSAATRVEAFRTYPTFGAAPYSSSQAFVEGIGSMNYWITSGSVVMGTKVGVICSFGDCGRG